MPKSISYFQWTSTQKLAFRFFFLFFILYIFFNPNGVLPGVDSLFGLYIEPFHKLIPWVGKHVLHLKTEITVFTNGSGDTTYDYVVVFFILVIAVFGALTWSVLDRNRRSYNQLYYWLTVIVRYYAAFTMLTYGFVKVFKLQFPSPGLTRLLQPYGDSSPMGLAWTFMGYSKGYNYFTGFAEVLGGVLLLFRRTATAGALVTMIVMANVAAMNYSFDIPVKLLSTTVVVMALFLLAKDFGRLINFFILNKPTEAGKIFAPPVRKKWLRITLLSAKVLLVGYTFFTTTYFSYSALSQYGDQAPRPPLYGIYDVELFVRNNDTLPPLKTDTIRWNKLIIGTGTASSVKLLNDSTKRYAFKYDSVAKNVTMYSYVDTANKSIFAYTLPEKDIMELRGRWNGDSAYIRLKKFDLNRFRLVNRGFNWVNEYPYNR